MQNFVEIGQIAAEIWQFYDFFKMTAAAILAFQTLKLLTVLRLKRAKLRRHAKFC